MISDTQRNIYVGDIITLEIISENITVAEIEEKFQSFEITEIEQTQYGYQISLRTFDIGQHIVLIGNKEIIIEVQSTLLDIEHEGIFEANWPVEPTPTNWNLPLYASASIFILTGIIILMKKISKTTRNINPYEEFLRLSSSLLSEEKNYFVYLTLYFKEYIEKLYERRIIGKTSSEIIVELKSIEALFDILPRIEDWLSECDRFKFTGISISSEEKQNHYDKLLSIAQDINRRGNSAC